MSRIYYRGGMSPFETFSPGYILTHNVIGTNVGNFLYLNGVLRSLMIDDNTVIQANYYNTNYYKPEYVNENFDCFVIPLADAFRENFVNELNELTSFVKKLKIPCYVIGVGLKESYEPDFSQPKPQDEAVKKFVTAVLEKSNCIGVRGELTGKYLETLGFAEGRDFMVIGCPSMYMKGKRLHIQNPKLDVNSKVCFNSNVAASVPTRKFIKLKRKEFRRMKVFANTDVGLVRQLNEDDYCIAHNANDEWMAIVCDGIGGAKAGEVASHTAVMTMYEAFMKSPVFKKDRQVDNWIRENLNQANDFIYSKSLKNPNERGMGTTAVGVIKAHIGTFIFNVGDSRIYADYNNELIQMSEDHSVIAQLLKEGKITLDEAKSHPQKNTLTNALGVWHVFRIDINKIENTYKYLLVSSDGLHGYVEKKVISDIVHDSSLSLQEKTETLIARANQSGGYDNCTVILMENDGE